MSTLLNELKSSKNILFIPSLFFYLINNSKYLSKKDIYNEFSKLYKQGCIYRLSNNPYIYALPINGKFGFRPPSTNEIIDLISEHTGEIIVPHGAADANFLGLSQQVPIKEFYFTTGKSKILNFDGYEVIIKHNAYLAGLGNSREGRLKRAQLYLNI